MDKQKILDELVALLEANGVEVRRESFGGGGGGLCRVKGQTIFFIDEEASLAEKAAICAEAVSEVVNIEDIYIRPEVRECILNNSKDKNKKEY